MNDKIVFGQYYPSNSWIHKLDPRVKLISIMVMMISLFILDDIRILLGFLGGLLIVILTTKIPLVKFLNSIKMMSFVLAITFFLQLFFRKEGNIIADYDFNLTWLNLGIIIAVLLMWFMFLGRRIKAFKTTLFVIMVLSLFVLQYYLEITPLITRYNVKVYDESLKMASYIVLRIMALLFISSLLTLTTKPTELNLGLESLLKPFKKIGINISVLTMMISIALRFIPTLIQEADKILKAQASRGADFKEGKLKDRIMQIVSLIVPMFIIAYKRAYDLADAMEARGYIPENDRTSIYILKYKVADYLVYLFNVLLIAFCVVFKVVL